MLNRLIHFTDSQLSEIQAGFRAGRSCADQVFTMRRTIEMTRRENIPIYACFIDLKAAYDSVNREALWRIVSDYGLPGKECRLIQSLYQGTSAAVRCEGGLTDWFEVRTGLRQGCMLSPALFNIFIDFVVRKALIGKEAYGLEIEYSLPDGRRYRGDKVDGQDHLLALLYADDLVVTCRTEEGLRACVESLEDKTQMWGLSISVKKTKWMIVNDPDRIPEDIEVRGEVVEKVSEFQYLGSVLSSDGTSFRDINRRIALGTRKFMQLRKTVWQRPEISVQTKIQIYRAIVLSTTLYGSESWTCSETGYAKLNTFHNNNLRMILGLRRREIHNEDLYKKAGIPSLENLVRANRIRWAGHVRRMRGIGSDGFPKDCPEESHRVRWPKKILFGNIREKGKHGKGRPVCDWTQSLHNDLRKVGVTPMSWVGKSKKWEEWKLIHRSLSSLPSKRGKGL